MPARSTRSDSSGENGVETLKRTVEGSTTSTLATGASSPLRADASVVFLSYGIDPGSGDNDLFVGLTTRNGGETAPMP